MAAIKLKEKLIFNLSNPYTFIVCGTKNSLKR